MRMSIALGGEGGRHELQQAVSSLQARVRDLQGEGQVEEGREL